MPGIVTAAAITLDQDRGGTGEVRLSIVVPPMAQAIAHKLTGIMAGTDLNVTDILFFVIKAMRDNDTGSAAGEVMVIGQQGFQRIQMSLSIKVAQVLLFFRIHTENGVASRPIFRGEAGDVLKLLVAEGNILLHRALLLSFAPPIIMFLQQLAHNPSTDSNVIIFPQSHRNLPGRQICPTDLLIHRIPGGMRAQHFQKLFINVFPTMRVRLAPRSRFANTRLRFLTGQPTHFFGSLADGPAATMQDPRNVVPPAQPQFQCLNAGVTTTGFFIQAVVKALHRFFNFRRIGLHHDLLFLLTG